MFTTLRRNLAPALSSSGSGTRGGRMVAPFTQLNSRKAAVVLQAIILAAKSVELLTGHCVTRLPARVQNSPTKCLSTLRGGNAT